MTCPKGNRTKMAHVLIILLFPIVAQKSACHTHQMLFRNLQGHGTDLAELDFDENLVCAATISIEPSLFFRNYL